MTHRHPYPPADLQEALSRNHTAAHLLGTMTRTTPAYTPIWEYLASVLADSQALINELAHLRTELTRVRRSRADLLAAAQATLTATRDGERDPLYYLRDEIAAQHSDTRGDGR
ncbi:hypothetical protein [Nonomuraea longicatena]|uniref:Uncharacterized protein n=1 Tax=Nonomuraea longicatena TaxID=83682 RepID=A0ABP3Z365_9ACTN